MCGIVGYVGDHEAVPILIGGLAKLEYRGYDSAGVAVLQGDKIEIRRMVGKLSNLQKSLKEKELNGTVGIGHTRWATHGKPSEQNAHPHRSKGCVLVHNGIIENYQPLKRKLTKITWDASAAEKSGFPHFMLKEIHEQPQTILDTMRGRYSYDTGEADLPEIGLTPKEFAAVGRIWIVACGTSWHAGLVGKYLLEEMVHTPVQVDIGSEFRYRDPLVDKDDLFITISQSGETADTLAAAREAKEKGARIVSIVNVVGSTLARESDGVFYTHCGPEIGVASTKAFTAQLTALYMLALHLGRVRGTLSVADGKAWLDRLVRLPVLVKRVLDREAEVVAIAKRYYKKRNFLFLGRGINYPIALEGALKLKEVSYIHAEGYAAGEMKHGPLA